MRPLAIVAAITLALAAAACTGDPEDGGARGAAPQVRWHDCDAVVEATFLSKHRCGTLTVPQDRGKPEGPTVDLAVLQVWPVGVQPEDGLMTGFADNIGDPRGFGGGMAAGATRIGHVGVELAFRGTQPSTPTLVCPEVDALSAQAAALPDDDPVLLAGFVESVGACATRLRDAGVEPAAFDSAAAAADVDDLRRAMGVDSWWGAGSYGTQSRVLLRYLDDFPNRLQAAWLDSPWFPEVDDLTGGALGTRSALAELFAACSGDASCDRRYPDLESAWDRALTRTAKRPLAGSGRGVDGRVDVLVDDAKLLRFVRFSLGGDGSTNLTWLPATISDAAAGRLDPHLADLVASDPLFCAGYRPLCTKGDVFAWGVYLTSLCKEQLPGLDQDALSTAVGDDAAYEQVFVQSPYLAACDAWDTPGDGATVRPDPGGTSLLLLPGQFDSFSRPEWSQEHASTWDQAWTFTAPNNTHNTLGYDECGLSVRNAWVSMPTSPPEPARCSTPPSLSFR